MSFAAAWRLRRLHARARKETRTRLRQVRKLSARQAFRLPEPVQGKLSLACAHADAALASRDHDATCRALIELDELALAHLTFPQKSTFREYAESIAVAVLIALFLRAFVVEAFKIPSGSMIPTMQVGDHIFVNKFIYGLRVPFTNLKLFEWRAPHRGEVIVFIYPKEPDKDFIKRVVGVGGDRIEVRNNTVYVNGEKIARRPLPGNCEFWDYLERHDQWELKHCARFEEKLGDDTYVTIDEIDDGVAVKNFPAPEDDPYVVPAGHVFVMGDNRNNSHDSRFWGAVPIENIKGKAMVIWWSQGSPEEGVRWDRLGHVVD